MQTRYYPNDDGYRVWLDPEEWDALLDVYRGQHLERTLALMLGLHGLRTDEIVKAERGHFRLLDGDGGAHKLRIPMGKRERRRECPASPDLVQLANYTDARANEPMIGVTKKSVRDWIQEARTELVDETGEDRWQYVSMHDLRRTWATSTFYTLAYQGVPIAEELTMGWGGWKMTDSGRQTFRQNYLGPEPDWVASQTMELLTLPG